MNSKFINVIMFAAGAAIGSVVTWKLITEKYKKIAQEEIDSVKETFAKREALEYYDDANTQNLDEINIEDLLKYSEKLNEEGYTNYSDISKPESKKKEDEDSMKDRPYVISPDEFDEYPEYEKRSLTYYADKILTDEDDEPIEDIDAVIGLESLNTFGQYEDDSVFVRDDILKCDYEILLDLRRYQDDK